LLAAQTSWGKSSAGVLVCLKNCGTAARPLVVSTEDKRLMYAKRMVASDCKINAIALRDNRLKLEDLRRLTRAAQDVPDEPIFLDAVGPGKNVEWVAKAIAELSKECGTSLVILDYIQRFKTDRFGSDKRNQVTYMGETLGDAIKTSNCAGLALSQLRRTNGKEPSMDDVKESGDLENMAEHVMIGWRKVEGEDRDENGAAKRMLNIPKNKDGPVFFNWLELEFDVTTASFTGQLADHRPDNIKQFDDFGDAQNWSDP
jgi:replicative DNA helicase